MIALTAGLVHAVEVPFAPFANVAKDVTIQPQEAKNKFGATDYLEFPAMPKKPGMTAVLKLNQRIAQDRFAGWNRGVCVVEINGKELTPKTADGKARLLYRGEAMRMNHHKEKTLPYWTRYRGHDAMPSFFAPITSEELDKRALDREFGYDLYLIVDDVVSANSTNKLRVLDILPKHIVNLPLFVKEATVGYIPNDKLTLKAPQAAPKKPQVEKKPAASSNKVQIIENAVPEKGRIPFTPVMVIAKDVTIKCEEAIAYSDVFEFPAVPQKKGMTIVLKLNQRILSKPNGGWNRYCGIEINKNPMRNVTERNYPRLLGRGHVMRTTHPKEPEVPYWLISSRSLLLSFFGPAENENIDNRILDREFGYNFHLVVDDMINKLIIGADDRVESDKPNSIRFSNHLSSRFAATALYIKEAVIGYVPTDMINELSGVKMQSHKPIPDPAAVITGKGFALNVSKTGGMELKVGKGSLFFETLFSYPNKPVMKFNTFGLDKIEGQPGISAQVKKDGTVIFKTGSLIINRKITSCGHYIRIIDNIKNISNTDLGLVWKNTMCYSGKMPESWRLSGVTGNQLSNKRGAANPTIFITDKKTHGVGIIAEDTISRNLIDLRIDGNIISLGSQGLGIRAGKSIKVDWTIYPLSGKEIGYFDFINQVREDWGVNNTIPGPFRFSFGELPGLNLQFAFIGHWHNYGPGWEKFSDKQYLDDIKRKAATARNRFPGIKVLGKVETNLVPCDIKNFSMKDRLPLTRGNRQHPLTKYGQYLPPDVSQKLVEFTPYRDSMLWNANKGVMIDNYYTYDNYDTINLMVQVETGNYRYKKFMEQIELIMDKGGLDGVYIDQFNPTNRDGIDYSKWDGYSVELDKAGNIASKYYNFAITGADGRMKIIKKIVSKGGIAFTNGHPVTREEQNSGRLSFAEMENDPVDPNAYLDGMPPETSYTASGHLASPIILNLRPGRYTKIPYRAPNDPRARYMTKGMILALRNGNIPYYYTADIPTTGPNAGSYEITNWFMPFTPVKLGEGVMVGKERTIVCISGTYIVKGNKKPDIAKFDSYGRPVKHDFKVTGKPGAWSVEVKLNDWNEIAAMVVKN